MTRYSKLLYGSNAICVVAFLILCQAQVWAQNNLKIKTEEPNYISVNQVDKSRTFNIYDGNVHLEYQDHIGQSPKLFLNVFDWKTSLIGRFPIDKSLGTNHYSFNLADVGIAFLKDQVYRFELVDENKTRYDWNVRCVEKPTDNMPKPTILIKPQQVGCNKYKRAPVSNLIDFYGTVSGGSAPFNLNWYVMNSARTEFIYQPKEEKIQEALTMSMIRIDKNPVYNVMLLVTDACGNTGKQMIRVSCSEKKKKINTLVVEPLDRLQTIKSGSK